VLKILAIKAMLRRKEIDIQPLGFQESGKTIVKFHDLLERGNYALQFIKKCVNYLLEEIEPPLPSGIIYEHEMVAPKIQDNIVVRAVGIVVIIAMAFYMTYAFMRVTTGFTFLDMALALFFGAFYYVLIKHYRFDVGGILFVIVPLTIFTTLISPPLMGSMVLIPLMIMMVLLNLKNIFNNRAKIRLIITNTSLLIRAPKYYHSPLTYGGELRPRVQ